MSSLITASGPRLSQDAIDRIAGEIYRPKAQDDAGPNQALLSSLPGSRLEALVGSFTSPAPGDAPDAALSVHDRYEVNVRPKVVMNEEDLGVGFPKGIPADVVERQRETAQEQYDAAREAQRKAEEARKAEEDKRAQEGSGGTEDPGDPPDMPNPDSGDPGGPRSLDPYLYQPQPLLVKSIAAVAIR